MPTYNNEELIIKFVPEEDKEKYSEEEIQAYIDRGRKKYGKELKGITLQTIEDDPDSVDIYYDIKTVPFTRLRRITGYLVGNMTRWNDAKRAEEHDRVKHEV